MRARPFAIRWNLLSSIRSIFIVVHQVGLVCLDLHTSQANDSPAMFSRGYPFLLLPPACSNFRLVGNSFGIAVAVPYWASRPRCELTKAKSVRYVFPMFGTRGAHTAVIAEHLIEAQRFALRGRSETCVRDSRVRHSSG